MTGDSDAPASLLALAEGFFSLREDVKPVE